MTISKKFLEKLSVCIKNGLINKENEVARLKQKLNKTELKDKLLDENEVLTYKLLYKHLIRSNYNNIEEFINKYSYSLQKKFEPQESIFRLFSFLKLFDIKVGEKILSSDYEVSNSNFSLGRLEKIDDYDKYKEIMKSKLKDKGDISDLTFISKDEKEIVICSSKNYNKAHTKFDIDEIYEVYSNKFSKFSINIVLIVPRKDELSKTIDRMLDSSSTIRELLRKTIKIDWNDLNEAYLLFKKKYITEKLPKIFPKMEKNELKLYLNQRYSVMKVKEIMQSEQKQRILLGQKPRSGKTYIMAGIISEDKKLDENKKLYIIVTPVPSETKQQYIDALKFKEFEDCQILDLTSDTINNNLKKKNNLIVIVSKQFLGFRDDDDQKDEEFDKKKNFYKKILKEYTHRITFLDEVHYGGTTIEARNILKDYNLDKSHLIFVTATYDKAINSYNIDRKNFVLWDLDDENICKTIIFNTEYKKNRLIEKHGEIFEKLLNEYSEDQIVKEYEKAPDIKFHTMKLNDTFDFILSNKEEVADKSFPPGFSTTALFTVRNGDCIKNNCEFLYENSVNKFIKMLFGNGEKSYYNQIDEYCKINKSRRYTKETPGTIMMFLPENNVNVTSYALKNVINNITKDFDVLILNNSNDKENMYVYNTTNVKEIIKIAIEKSKGRNKGVIALLGKQASIGVTIESCDIVILADGGITNRDMTQQRMFRCGSDGINKRFGFVIDTNHNRIFDYIGNLANNSRNNTESTESAIRWILDSNLIEFCNDDWIENVFKKKEITDEELVQMIYGKYLETNNIRTIMDQIIIEEDERLISLIKNSNIVKGADERSKMEKKNTGVNRKKEMDKIESLLSKNDKKGEENDELEEIDINMIYDKIKAFKEIIDYMVPLCVLFSKTKGYNININVISNLKKQEPELYDKLIEEISKSWFNGNLDEKTEKILDLYINIIEEQDNINVINDLNKLFETKDKLKLYTNIEKNMLKILINRTEEADIVTPTNLVNEMLDKLPKEIWNNKYLKWFEPAVGRGAFIIEIYNRLMDGLKEKIKNYENRSDYIIKEMLYMSELNLINIEILRSIFYEKKQNIKINYTKNIKKNYLKIYLEKDGKEFYELDIMKEIEKKIENEKTDTNNNLESVDDELLEKISDLNIKEESIDDITKEFIKLNIDDKETINAFLELKTKMREKEKKQFGEVFTPRRLINEMLDKLPKKVWKDMSLKWYDPAVGIGNFMIEIYYRLMEGLVESIPEFSERKRYIINNMLYMSELNLDNINECKRVFDNDVNIYEGDTLEMNDNYFGIDKFDIIIGNPPYNKNGIRAPGRSEKSVTIWPEFIKKCLNILKEDGYLLFITPLTWIKKSHSLHDIMFNYHIHWIKLWNNMNAKKMINATIPISIYMLQKSKTDSSKLTYLESEIYNKRLQKSSYSTHIDKSISLPLGGFSILSKLKKFVEENNCELTVHTKTVKSYDEEFSLPKNYNLQDKLCITTYTLKDGYKVKRSKEDHPDADKRKIIIANKSNFIGMLIDDGKLGMTGNHKFYILGDDLEFVKKILTFKFIHIINAYTKYGMDFIDKEAFSYIPDLRKIGKNDITEKEFYNLIGLTKNEIDEIKNF
jgi:hypothetical protein